MTSGSKSKAQRRADSQRRAAEKRAAERRQKQMRVAVRVGGLVVLVALVVIVITQVTGGGSGTPAQFTNPHVPLQAIPASMSSTWVQPPASSPGPETVGVPSGPKLATLVNAATGQTIDGVQCQAGEQTGRPRPHAPDHLRERQGTGHPLRHRHPGLPGRPNCPRAVRLDRQLFLLAARARLRRDHPRRVADHDAGLHLGPVLRRVGSTAQHHPGRAGQRARSPCSSPHPASSRRIYTGDPRNLPLGDHYQIQLDVGTPIVAPVKVTNWGGL